MPNIEAISTLYQSYEVYIINWIIHLKEKEAKRVYMVHKLKLIDIKGEIKNFLKAIVLCP